MPFLPPNQQRQSSEGTTVGLQYSYNKKYRTIRIVHFSGTHTSWRKNGRAALLRQPPCQRLIGSDQFKLQLMRACTV